MLGANGVAPRAGLLGPQDGTARIGAPAPGVSEPERRQEIQLSLLRPAIADLDADKDVVDVCLCIVGENVEIFVFVEGAGIEQLVLGAGTPFLTVPLDELAIGELGLRILVEVPHVRMRRRAVEVVIQLLNVLSVVSLLASEA